MTVLQGLSSVANSDPGFSNNKIVSLINNANINFVIPTYNVAQQVGQSTVITASQASDIYNTMETQGYLNIGRYLLNLKNHTNAILTGQLGQELIPGQGSGSFLDHLSLVNGMQGAHQYLYGTHAGTSNKGINDHFGSVAGTLDQYIIEIQSTVEKIHAIGLAEETNYSNAATGIANYVQTLADSTAYDSTTLYSLLNTFKSAADAFNDKLSDPAYVNLKNKLLADRNAINYQLDLEFNNLSSINTYSTGLINTIKYQGMASNSDIAKLIANTAGNTSWQDYFSNYQSRLQQVNPKFVNNNDLTEAINQELKIKGLPDVTDSNNLQAVSYKASKDTRFTGKVTFAGRTVGQIIADCCDVLGISTTGLNTYGQSQILLQNMNNNDIEIIKNQILNSQQATTLS
jgi:hypothetical protein